MPKKSLTNLFMDQQFVNVKKYKNESSKLK